MGEAAQPRHSRAEQGAKRRAQTLESIPLHPPKIAAVQKREATAGAAVQMPAPPRRLEVTAWILGSTRVVSLLAPPVDDERRLRAENNSIKLTELARSFLY
ncbi:hypothetical protein MPLDJ20_200035 [Mesorhizobium plurifarium]|uniref:Uncharacterized protein n=1 Tax=Mesorhizobium plurifarium TaxID=69974 RepID=A0A090F6U2_MESPL|nr:hypothetical protein MPLDJ20_200035 [Mesorhizobium plurifarium]